LLTKLSIKNFAIIKELKLNFNSGFNVITGETGAGKSIIINAINVLIGSRASTEFIRQGENFAEVCGYFKQLPKSLLDKLRSIDIEVELEEIIIRRIIRKDNPSRIYINSSPVSINFLQTFMEEYFSILSQHQNQYLFKTNKQLELYDNFLKINPLKQELFKTYNKMQEYKKNLTALTNKQDEILRKKDYYLFQIKELEELDIKDNEDIKLSAAVNKAKISIQLVKAISDLNKITDKELSSVLTNKLLELSKYKNEDDSINNLLECINKLLENIDLVLLESKNIIKKYNIDEEELEQAKLRLAEINRLKKKFNVVDFESLIKEFYNMKEELNLIENFADELLNIEKSYLETKNICENLAEQISIKRKEGLKKFCENTNKYLSYLNMDKANFYVDIEEKELCQNGYDAINFKISTNPGEPLKPINKIASGGELSRIMLAIQNATSSIYNFGIEVYDEIDAGLGGELAFKIGHLLKNIANRSQIIVITHLPQIAVFADQHLSINKTQSFDETSVSADKLSENSRLEELTKMLGMKDEHNSILNIKDMINKAKNYLQT